MPDNQIRELKRWDDCPKSSVLEPGCPNCINNCSSYKGRKMVDTGRKTAYVISCAYKKGKK